VVQVRARTCRGAARSRGTAWRACRALGARVEGARRVGSARSAARRVARRPAPGVVVETTAPHAARCATTRSAPTRSTRARARSMRIRGCTRALTFDPGRRRRRAVRRPRRAAARRVLREQGVNGQVEMAAALDRAGFEARRRAHDDLLERPRRSRASAAWSPAAASRTATCSAPAKAGRSRSSSTRARATRSRVLRAPDTFTLGVCNGCQMLAALARDHPRHRALAALRAQPLGAVRGAPGRWSRSCRRRRCSSRHGRFAHADRGRARRGPEDQRELADLRHRQPGEEAGALAVAHRPHDGEHDQRVADQHEQREHDRRRRSCAPSSDRSSVAPSAMKKNSSRKSRSGASRADDRLAVGRGGERDARQQAAELLAEPDRFADRAKIAACAIAKDEQLRRARQPLRQRVGDVAHEQPRPGRGARCRIRARPSGFRLAVARADADGRQHDHREYDDEVLDDQEAERDLAVQRVDLALVRQQLDDDDRAGERQRDRDVEARTVLEPSAGRSGSR
jgi:hypothetical protein